jgi:hypothetical protein
MRAAAWLALVVAAGCTVHPVTLDNPDPNAAARSAACLPEFPDQGGWLGADAAYSVSLRPNESLWLFGDTFVAADPAAARGGADFLRNSIGISACDSSGRWSIRYYWRIAESAAPRPFFDSGTDEYWYWPLDGFAHDGSVYVALAVMKNKPEKELFSFQSVGVHLARISRLSESPLEWMLEYRVLFEGEHLAPGSTIVLDKDHAYFFALYDDPAARRRHMILTRLRTANLDDPEAHLEYLARDGAWRTGVGAADARVVIESGHSEMSVRFHPVLDQWIAVSDGGFLSDRIMVRTAPALTGPWSSARPIHRFPEMSPGTSSYDEDTWCYAVKEHAEFGQGSRILVTYACNSVDFAKQLTNPEIYRPRAVPIDLRPQPAP